MKHNYHFFPHKKTNPMKKPLFSFSKYIIAVLLLLCSVKGWGQVTLVNYKFDNRDLNPEVGSIGSPSLTLGNSNNFTYTNGSGGTGTYALTTSSNGTNGYFEITISTTGYTNITIGWAGRTSNTTNPGTWVLTGDSGSGYGSAIYTQSGLTTSFASTDDQIIGTAFNNNANIKLKITANNSSSRTMRIDDIVIKGIPLSTNTITTSAITGSPFCVSSSAGANVSVGFTSVGTFTSGNVYTAQLSDATGSFVSATNIGALSSTGNTGSISATIPAGAVASAGYRIRVVSSSPLVTGTDNGINLMVSNSAVITGQPSTSTQTLCQGNTATALSVTATGASTYQWYSNTSNSNSGGTSLGSAAQTSMLLK